MTKTSTAKLAKPPHQALLVALLVWLLAFALHNTEESWLGFPAWLAAHVALVPTANATVFTGVVIALTAIAAIVVWAYAKYRAKWAKILLLVYIAGTLINAISHAAMTVWAGSYTPGLASSLLLVLPADIWLLYEFKKNTL